jgi:hypothetical protein
VAAAWSRGVAALPIEAATPVQTEPAFWASRNRQTESTGPSNVVLGELVSLKMAPEKGLEPIPASEQLAALPLSYSGTEKLIVVGSSTIKLQNIKQYRITTKALPDKAAQRSYQMPGYSYYGIVILNPDGASGTPLAAGGQAPFAYRNPAGRLVGRAGAPASNAGQGRFPNHEGLLDLK